MVRVTLFWGTYCIVRILTFRSWPALIARSSSSLCFIACLSSSTIDAASSLFCNSSCLLLAANCLSSSFCCASRSLSLVTYTKKRTIIKITADLVEWCPRAVMSWVITFHTRYQLCSRSPRQQDVITNTISPFHTHLQCYSQDLSET